MATVYIETRQREKRNSYIIYYKHPVTGKNRYYRSLPLKREAQQEAHKLRLLIDTGKLPEECRVNRRPRLLTVKEIGGELAEVWKQKLSNGEITSNTFDDYSLRLEQIVVAFKEMLACEIRKDDILNYRNNLSDKISNATSNRNLFILKQLFQYAMAQGIIHENPCYGIKYLSEKDHERNSYVLPQMLNQLVEASQEIRAKFYMPSLIYLGAEHGTSRQEAIGLKWHDIDFDYKGVGLIRFYRAKNDKERTEYLMPRTKKALLEWKSHLEFMRHRKKIQPIEERFVFCRLNGTPIKRFDSAWRHVCKIAGIDDFHYHDLRHTFCSNLLLAGANIKDVKEMIGHSDIEMTDRYSHLTLEHHKAMQDRLAKHYEGQGTDPVLS